MEEPHRVFPVAEGRVSEAVFMAVVFMVAVLTEAEVTGEHEIGKGQIRNRGTAAGKLHSTLHG
jgi:hypothetical protein